MRNQLQRLSRVTRSRPSPASCTSQIRLWYQPSAIPKMATEYSRTLTKYYLILAAMVSTEAVKASIAWVRYCGCLSPLTSVVM